MRCEHQSLQQYSKTLQIVKQLILLKWNTFELFITSCFFLGVKTRNKNYPRLKEAEDQPAKVGDKVDGRICYKASYGSVVDLINIEFAGNSYD